jgi:hypothetical protein
MRKIGTGSGWGGGEGRAGQGKTDRHDRGRQQIREALSARMDLCTFNPAHPSEHVSIDYASTHRGFRSANRDPMALFAASDDGLLAVSGESVGDGNAHSMPGLEIGGWQ